MFRTWLIYILTLIGTIIFFFFYKMWFAWYILMIILAIPFICLILSIIATSKIRFSEEAPSLVQINDKASISITVSGVISLISFVRFKAEMHDLMADTHTILGDYKCISTVPEIPVDTTHCGTYEYRITKIKVYDLFGFFGLNCLYDNNCKVIVRPVPVMPSVDPDLDGYKAKRLRKSKSRDTDLYDIRDYTKGDSMKTVHWKVSAKRDRLLVKEPQKECFAYARDLIDLTADRDSIDESLGEVLFTSIYYLDHDIIHKIRVRKADRREIFFDIESEKDLDRTLYKILNMRLPKEKENADR